MRLLCSFLFIIFTLYQPVPAQSQTEGPARGALIIMGGSATDPVFMKKFAHLSGGLDAEILVIPSAAPNRYLSSDDGLEQARSRFIDYGFTSVNVLHTRDRNEADSPEFAQNIESADGVWFTGGRQWRVTKAYLGTRTEKALHDLLERGGVIAGSSAGASLQASFLVRGEDGDNTIMMGDYQEGFGFLTNSAIDQHLLARNRQFDLFEVLRKHDQLLGIGIDENTGIIVRDDRFRVIGNSYVAIYDGTRWSAERDTIYQLNEGEEQFYFLEPGDDYDLANRKVVSQEDRVPVKIKPDHLEKLAGEYRRNESTITVFMRDSTLHIRLSTDERAYSILPESDYHFFNPNGNGTLTFNRDKHGQLSGLTLPDFGNRFWERIGD